jgi:hypothetical protein
MKTLCGSIFSIHFADIYSYRLDFCYYLVVVVTSNIHDGVLPKMIARADLLGMKQCHDMVHKKNTCREHGRDERDT